jgi:hypothetical protein
MPLNLVYTHVIEWALYTAGVLQLRTNQGRVERLQSVWISELEWQSSDKSQHRKSLTYHDVHMFQKFIFSSMMTPTLKIIYRWFSVKSTILYLDLSKTINPFWLVILPFYIVNFTVLLLILPFYCWIQQYEMVKLTVKT